MKELEYECLMGQESRYFSQGILNGEMVQIIFYRGMFMK